MLVIETDGVGDYYYSLNGSDPETFGFAYDGPVLIDLDGPVVWCDDYSLFSKNTQKRLKLDAQLIGLVVTEDKEIKVVKEK